MGIPVLLFMRKTISPQPSVTGLIHLPGDKSISHRYSMLAAVAEGTSRLHNYASGADCHSTLGCIRSLGIDVRVNGTEVEIDGRGLYGYQAPAAALDAGNSGTIMRMLTPFLAAQPFTCTLGGDESVSRRPMRRVLTPLREMGARLTAAREDNYPPLTIEGGPLRAIDYSSPVASAQVKSCVLFAGLYADGITSVNEPLRTRDHSEIALREFGADVKVSGLRVAVTGKPSLRARELTVPGDLSSAAFFLVAALQARQADLTIKNVGLNPTRAALLDFLMSLGARIQVINLESNGGELIGDLRVTTSQLKGGVMEGAMSAALIDEIPVLAVLGAAGGGLEVRDAKELRVKETDRIQTLVDNFQRMGIVIEERPDGFRVEGGQTFRPATVDSFGDHRIAMAFAVAALRAEGECTIENADAASVSFPEFWQLLGAITAA
jgi:3-phosphoshikimate 1-carboxyvinyltransferase